MKFVVALVMSFILQLVPDVSQAGTPNEIFRPMAKFHVQKLLDKDVKVVGKLNLKKLIKELDAVEWRSFELGFLSGSGGKRTTSIYMVEKKMIAVNMYALQNLVGKPVPMYSWALHESLGALGYSDENYEVSGSISFLANLSDSEDFELGARLVKAVFEEVTRTKKERLYLLAGGSTVVGGGGDAEIIELKQKLLKKLLELLKRENFKEEFMRNTITNLLKMPINFNLDRATTFDPNEGASFTFANGGLEINAIATVDYDVFYGEMYLSKLLIAVLDKLVETK